MIQVYTGNGKGKTTAALGLILRASGAGKKVYLCQFLKGKDCCELRSLKKYKNIKVEQFGTKCFVRHLPTEKDIKLAQAGLKAVKKAINGKSYSLVVLDEINIALKLRLIDLEDILAIIKSTPKETELVLTGRNAHPQVIQAADLVSEIKEKKHYFKKGMRARRGIEF